MACSVASSRRWQPGSERTRIAHYQGTDRIRRRADGRTRRRSRHRRERRRRQASHGVAARRSPGRRGPHQLGRALSPRHTGVLPHRGWGLRRRRTWLLPRADGDGGDHPRDDGLGDAPRRRRRRGGVHSHRPVMQPRIGASPTPGGRKRCHPCTSPRPPSRPSSFHPRCSSVRETRLHLHPARTARGIAVDAEATEHEEAETDGEFEKCCRHDVRGERTGENGWDRSE